MTQPFVAAQVLGAHHPVLRARIAECGDVFRFETHVETRTADNNRSIGLRVSCLCPEGHGVSGRRWTGWLEPYMGRYDLVIADYTPAAASTDASTDTNCLDGTSNGAGADVVTLTTRPLSMAA